MATTYYDCPVKVGTFNFVAQSATVEETIPMLPIRSLGASNSIKAIPENTIQGSVNINFLLSFGGSSLTPQQVIDWTCINRIEPTELSGNVGPAQFYNAVVSSFSLNADAQSVVNCSLSLNYFKHGNDMGTGGTVGANTFAGGKSFAHGINSSPNAGAVGLNNNLFSFSFQISQSVNPIKFLGNVNYDMLLKTNGELTATFVGNNIPDAIRGDAAKLCKGAAGAVSFTATSCDGNSTSVNLPQTSIADGDDNAYHISRSVEVSENNALNGSATITQYF